MQESSPARLYAGVVGATLTIAGILGFFYNADFTSNPADRDAVLGLLDVNGWHNVVHLLTGLLGLIAFMAGAYASRSYAIALGIIYSAVAVWGLIIGSGDSILGIVPINTADNVLHLSLGLLGLAAAQMWGVSAAVAVVMLFGIAIPGIVTSDNDSESLADKGQVLYVEQGCANCHTLAASGSLGTIGPDLNEIKPDQKRVLNAIKNGGVGSGAMPKGLAQGEDADAIAAYVADASGAPIPPDAKGGPPGKQIFAINCGSCHTLADAGTSGAVGPNLDQIKPSKSLVLGAIKSGPGAMPPNIVTGKDAQQVAAYVSSVAGKK